MPNRILKESICTSDTIQKLTWFEEVLFYRLIVNCDDFGRFDGRPAVIKGRLFPLKSGVTDKNIDDALCKLATVGLVLRYKCDGKPYLQLPTWEQHQVVRAQKSRYPAFDDTCEQMISNDSECLRNRIRNRESKTYNDIVRYLNEKAGTSFRDSSAKTRALIDARINDGYTPDDFKRVIDNKCAEWNHEPKPGEKDMRPYLRPETLFGSKFESYLNQQHKQTDKLESSFDIDEIERLIMEGKGWKD